MNEWMRKNEWNFNEFDWMNEWMRMNEWMKVMIIIFGKNKPLKEKFHF